MERDERWSDMKIRRNKKGLKNPYIRNEGGWGGCQGNLSIPSKGCGTGALGMVKQLEDEVKSIGGKWVQDGTSTSQKTKGPSPISKGTNEVGWLQYDQFQLTL